MGRVAELVGPGDRRAGKGCWKRGGRQQRLVSVGRGNEGTGVHGGEELTGVGGYGASRTKVLVLDWMGRGMEESTVRKLLQPVFLA